VIYKIGCANPLCFLYLLFKPLYKPFFSIISPFLSTRHSSSSLVMAVTGHSKHHKVIIIGAGFSGLAAAKTYLAIDPSVDLLIIDGDSAIGGVWSASRIYPGLEYEAPAPMMNYSDFDIRKELGVKDWGDVTGDQVNEYIVPPPLSSQIACF
jgi:hypothetical protein